MGLAALVGKAAIGPFSKALPAMGDTERAALEAGTVGFEGAIFAGKPSLDRLLAVPAGRLTPREQAFIDGPVRELCGLLDDFEIEEAGDLPQEVWRFLREKKFFGLIIPPEYGGLGFGQCAHAEVVTRIATVNTAAAVTVMVPSSLGPAELLLHYGTEAQKNHYLPRLASGADLPCFALTSPYAGSDAAAIPDRGVLTEREFNGRRTRGFAVTFSKRYITLAPVATLVGLAFNAIDPSRPQAEQALGITCALVPVPHPGVLIGRRHRPMDGAFMNGPVRGEDVFVPLDFVIGGADQVGKGWRMLMESLAAGRAVSLPALGSALQQGSLFVANAYARLRVQFGLPIGRFHAVAAPIAITALELYASDAARRFTAAALDQGERPSVAGAILKYHLTEAGRRAVTRSMDILGGKAICVGPGNLLAGAFRQAPIAITVEGANILTRALIIFGQGAVRCHPYVYDEMMAVERGDAVALGTALLGHARHALRNGWRTFFGAPVEGTPPPGLEEQARALARLSVRYALTGDLCMGVLGGKLKRLEQLSARLGDVLSHLYLAAACLWRYHHDPQPILLPIAQAAADFEFNLARKALADLYSNMPGWFLRWCGRVLMRGMQRPEPIKDRKLLQIAEMLREDERAIALLCPDLCEPRSGGMRDLRNAVALGRELGAEAAELDRAIRSGEPFEAIAARSARPELALRYLQAVDRVIQVDEFGAWR